MQVEKNGVSVIIATYNGADRIGPTLESISTQKIVGFPVELIVVDNASDDDTAEKIRKKLDCFPENIETLIFTETTKGQAYARKSGLEAAQYEYIIYCDDDNRLSPDYLSTVFEIFESKENVGVVGGIGLLESDIEIPVWFESVQSAYAVGPQASASGDVTARKYLWGAGMAVRRSVLQLCYRKYPSLLSGRSGKQLGSGDDEEICRWFILEGWRLWYDERLKYWHYIPQGRMNREYHEGLISGFRESKGALLAYNRAIEIQVGNFRPSFQKGLILLLSALANRLRGRWKCEKRLIEAQAHLGERLCVHSELYSLLRLTQANDNSP